MFRVYSHIKSDSLAQIRTTVAEVQKFLHNVIFIGVPCICSCRKSIHEPSLWCRTYNEVTRWQLLQVRWAQ